MMEITADVFNLPVDRVHTWEMAALGAAVAAAVSRNSSPIYPSAVAAMVHLREAVQPEAERVAVYERSTAGYTGGCTSASSRCTRRSPEERAVLSAVERRKPDLCFQRDDAIIGIQFRPMGEQSGRSRAKTERCQVRKVRAP